MTVRCGNHGFGAHVYHDNAAQVRACYAGKLPANDHELDPPGERQHRPNTFGPDPWDAAIQQQEREEDERVAAYKARRDGFWPEDPTVALNQRANDKGDGWQRTDINLDHVPEGAYAIDDPASGNLRFLEVDRPDEGKWENFIFVKVRASDELHKLGTVNPKYGRKYAGKAAPLVGALAALDEDGLKQAAIRFGLELGECGFCRRSLTDDEGDVNSRTLGYGPICAWRNGLPHPKARPPSN